MEDVGDTATTVRLATLEAAVREVADRTTELLRTLEGHLSVCQVLARRHEDLEEVLACAGVALESVDSHPYTWEQAIDLFVAAGRTLKAPLAERVNWDDVLSGSLSED